MADSAGSNRTVVGLAEQLVRTRRRGDLKMLAGQVAAALDRHGVLTDATAIAFRMLFVIAGALLLTASGPSTPPILRVGETILRFAFSAGVLLVLVAALLEFTTPAHVHVKWATLGSSIAIAIWLASSWLFGWYIANFA